jgi:hypothetical protein
MAVTRNLHHPAAVSYFRSRNKSTPLRLLSPQVSTCGCRSPDALLSSLLDAFPQSSLLTSAQRRSLTSVAKSVLLSNDSEPNIPGNPKKAKGDRVPPPKREDQAKSSSSGSGAGGPDGKKPGDEDGDDRNIQSLMMKALLWMLTGYIFVALLSVLVPSKNVAEPVR